MKLHEILSEQRKRRGMSIDALVKASGMPRGTVTKILGGFTENPGIETLKAITYALGLTLEDLDENKQPVVPAHQDSLHNEGRSNLERQLLMLFNEVNDEGQEKIIDYADDLVRSGKYEKKSGKHGVGKEA